MIVKNIKRALTHLKDHIEGNIAYENYLKHNKCHKKLNKKDFLRQKQQEKWSKVNRCC